MTLLDRPRTNARRTSPVASRTRAAVDPREPRCEPANVEVCNLSKEYSGSAAALIGLELAIETGEFLAVVGPSGSGKTTLLRLIAGLEEPSAGAVWIGNRPMSSVPPSERGVGFVFQNPALYPHLSVAENIAFGLRARRVRRSEVRQRVAQIADLLRIGHLLERSPSSLSGGEQQRTALGRALAGQPRVLLLDEPFASFDAPLRATLRDELLEIHRCLGTTTILVTHDQSEALALGTRIAVLEAGRLRQFGTPTEVYNQPSCRFVARFVGSPPMNVLPLEIERVGDSIRMSLGGVVNHLPMETAWAAPLRAFPYPKVELGIRPEHVTLPPPRASFAAFLPVTGTVVHSVTSGHETLATLDLAGQPLTFRATGHRRFTVGESVSVRLDLAQASWFDPATGRRLAAPAFA